MRPNRPWQDRSKSHVPRDNCAEEILTLESQQKLFNNSKRKLKQQGQKLEARLKLETEEAGEIHPCLQGWESGFSCDALLDPFLTGKLLFIICCGLFSFFFFLIKAVKDEALNLV